MSLLIKNAMIVNAGKMETECFDILCERSTIVKIAKSIKKDGVKTIDATGKLVMPGLIDMHVHFREPGQEHKETIETGMLAAVKGGFTTVAVMPNTTPVMDNRAIVEMVRNEAKRIGLCQVLPIGAISKGQQNKELTEMFELKNSGCVALSDDGFCVTNNLLMKLAFQYARMVGILLIQHCEDHALTCGSMMNEGENSTRLGLVGWPAVAETAIVSRDIELARYTDGRIHFAHMSLARSIDLIREAKKQGLNVTAEACPHHFTLTDDALSGFNTHAKVNPPLRTNEDVEGVKRGLKDGTIDCIVTDHAPHTKEDKEGTVDHAPCGMIGLETSVGLTCTQLVHPGVLTWEQMVDKMSTAQAKILGLEKKGVLAEGYDADITILDPEKEWLVTNEEFVSKGVNSPFVGMTLKGKVSETVYCGKVVYQL